MPPPGIAAEDILQEEAPGSTKTARWHKSLRGSAAGNAAIDGCCYYNNVRWNRATGHITPKDMVEEWQQRGRKLEQARKQRQIRREQAA
ncbi:MAG: hypothetical protein U0R19_35695 [Bryobacteraceae bacterium]